MDISTAISTWTGIIQYFFPVFTGPTAGIFMSLVTGWVLCTAKRTITGIVPFADPQGHRTHDAYHRFFPDAAWATSQLWKLLTILLVGIFYSTGVIPTDLDDTVFRHSGRKVNGTGWWRDALRSTAGCVVYAWGLNLVVLTLRIHPPWGGEPLGLPPKNRTKRRGRPRKRGGKLTAPEQMAKRVRNWKLVETLERGKIKKRLVYYKTVVWHHVSERPVLLVISRDPKGKEKDDFFFTTDLSLAPAKVIGGFAGRWSVEDTFKNTKQFLGAQEPQTWKGEGPRRAAAMGFGLYSVVWLWYLQQNKARRRFVVLPWYPGKTPQGALGACPCFHDALGCLRRELWMRRIKLMFEKSAVHNKITEFLIVALSSAA